MSAKYAKLSLAAIAGAFALSAASTAFAGSKELNDFDGNSSGWRATWSSQYDGYVDIVYRGTVGDMVFFEKDVTVTSDFLEGVEIVFERTDADSSSTLVINDEVVRNQSGLDWIGFHMVLASGDVSGTPNFAFATSDGSPGIGDFDISPFTNFEFGDNATRFSVAGGVVGNGDVWLPGAASNTGLAIVAGTNIRDSFTLKEIPVIIPLPAAAWTGLSTLLGLGLFGVARNARRLLA